MARGKTSGFAIGECRVCGAMGGMHSTERLCPGCVLRRERVHEVSRYVCPNWERRKLLMAAGGACQCCGESELTFLEVDHIFDDGSEARRDRKGGTDSTRVLRDAVSSGLISVEYQILCSNCNQGKRRNNGKCPHALKPGYPVGGAKYPFGMNLEEIVDGLARGGLTIDDLCDEKWR